MTTTLTSTARPLALGEAAAAPITLWHRFSGLLRRRAGRIEGMIVVLAMLAPLLAIALFGEN